MIDRNMTMMTWNQKKVVWLVVNMILILTSMKTAPQNHDHTDEKEDVEDDCEKDGQCEEPVAMAGFHPTLSVLQKLKGKHIAECYSGSLDLTVLRGCS